jgi:hypothetical protein
MKTILILLLSAAGLFAAEIPTGIDYTEKVESKSVEASTSLEMKSPDGEEYFPRDKKDLPTNYYRAAKLPSMQYKREEKGNVRFRLAVLEWGSKPIFLTYSRGAAGASIDVTRLQLRFVDSSYKIGDVELSGKVVVGDKIARELEAEALRPRVRTPLAILTEDQRQMCEGLDGGEWIIEVSTDTDYTVHSIWCPEGILAEPSIFEELKKQKVDAELIVDNLQSLIAFRDRLLEISDMKMPAYSVQALLEDTEQDGADQPATAHESKSEGKDKPQPDKEVAPR